MKSFTTILSIIVLFIFASISSAGIVNSRHDFSTQSWNTTGEICVVCHTPHSADISVAGAPLWNHEISIATYSLYDSNSLNAILGQPDGSSKLCLSCHDGTVAIDSFGGDTGSSMINPNGLIGTDLSANHPLSFTYDTTLATADGGLFDPASTNSGLGGTITNDLLSDGKLQCSSCHDVHNKANLSKLLVKDNTGSALCLTCHDK